MMGHIKLSNKMIGFICLVLSFIVEGISMLQSAEYWSGYATGYWGTLSVVLGGAIDICQVIFPVMAVACFVNERWISCIFFGILAAGAVYYSFLTSEAFSANKTNEQIVNAVLQSSEYKNKEKALSSATDTESLKDSIERLKASKKSDEEKIRADYATLIADARRLKMITTKNGVQDLTREMNDKIAGLQKTIDEKESLLQNQKSEAITVTKDLSAIGSGKGIKATKGIMPLAEKRNPNDPEGEAAKLNTWWNVFLILAGLGLSIGSGMFLSKEENSIESKQANNIVKENKQSETINNTASNNNKKDEQSNKSIGQLLTAKKQTKFTMKKKNKIGFHSDPVKKSVIEGIDNKQLKNYIKCTLDKTARNGDKAPGYRESSDIFEKEKEFRDIRGALITMGHFKSDDSTKVKRTLVSDRSGLEKLYQTL